MMPTVAVVPASAPAASETQQYCNYSPISYSFQHATQYLVLEIDVVTLNARGETAVIVMSLRWKGNHIHCCFGVCSFDALPARQ